MPSLDALLWALAALVVAASVLLADLVNIQYDRNDQDFARGTFRVRGDTVEIFPAYEEERAIRVELFGDDLAAARGAAHTAARAEAQPGAARDAMKKDG